MQTRGQCVCSWRKGKLSGLSALFPKSGIVELKLALRPIGQVCFVHGLEQKISLSGRYRLKKYQAGCFHNRTSLTLHDYNMDNNRNAGKRQQITLADELTVMIPRTSACRQDTYINVFSTSLVIFNHIGVHVAYMTIKICLYLNRENGKSG